MQVSSFNGNITRHFTWREALKSATADKYKILNEPDSVDEILAIRETAVHMEAVRALLDEPCVVTSWYRNSQVNGLVGGVPTSQHQLGEAVDFRPRYMSNGRAINLMRQNMRELQIDQLIMEPSWIHVSFLTHPSKRGRVPRHQYLDLSSR